MARGFPGATPRAYPLAPIDNLTVPIAHKRANPFNLVG
jgi:hypothetical protein